MSEEKKFNFDNLEENKNEVKQNQDNSEASTDDQCNVCTNDSADDEKLENSIQAELETINSQYIRLAADFDNYRKRYANERECLLKYGAEETLKKLLPVIDTFDMAQKSMETIDDPEKMRETFSVVKKQFLEALEKIGLQKIEAEGKEFDPNLHEAVMQSPANDVPDHTIISELQAGYKLCDKVLRPTLVNVAVQE